MATLSWRPKEGLVWNPLVALPRNMPCPCASGKKFKSCHLPNLPRVVPKDLAAQYGLAMKNPELVRFINDDKKDAVEAHMG